MKPLKGFTLPTISRCGLRPLDIAGDVEPLRGSTSLFCWITVSLLRQDRLLDQFCRRIIYDQRLIFRPRLPRLRPQRRPVHVVRLAPAPLALHGSQKSGLRRQVRRATRTRRRLEPHLLLAGELRDVIGRPIVREDDSQQLAFFVHSFHLIFGLLKLHPHTLPCPCSLSSIPLPVLGEGRVRAPPFRVTSSSCGGRRPRSPPQTQSDAFPAPPHAIPRSPPMLLRDPASTKPHRYNRGSARRRRRSTSAHRAAAVPA